MKAKHLLAILFVLLISSNGFCGTKSGTITYKIKLNASQNAKEARLWLPYPLSNEHQRIKNVRISGDYDSSAVYRDADSGAIYIYAEWNKFSSPPTLVMRFHADSKDRRITPLKDSDNPIPETVKKYLRSTDAIPADDYKKLAAKIVKGKHTILARSHAVYDWVVEHTFRDPEVKGCGLGFPGLTLGEHQGGGKCADISAVFVSLERAAGVPARDVFGLRLADMKDGDITSAFHCWTEFYLPGTGWVLADPADVRKMMLVHKIELKDAGKWRKFFWGGDDLFRVALERDTVGVVFQPAQKGAPLHYFMYPFAQVDGQSLNYFDPKTFTYSVTFKAD
jgi:hypothetical protein